MAEENDEKPWVEDDKPQVIVVGFGRFGQVIARLLMANKMRITVLERDIGAVNLMRKYGYKVYYGDATQVELLRSAGAEAAESIVITCNEPEDTMKLVALCQQHFPHLHILARARGRVEAHELLQAGVTQFSRETFSSALELGRKTLVSLGMHPHQAQRAQLHFRRLDMRMLRELIRSIATWYRFRAPERPDANWRRFFSAKCNRNGASWMAGMNLSRGEQWQSVNVLLQARNVRPVRRRIQWRCGVKIMSILLNALSAGIKCGKRIKTFASMFAKKSK